ncbi:DEAD/DEAH box helicase [Anianabacter salinae]|uniref:DEAD/DEAH box helicase n=1 Tax=Anianabacter salinae TaxID=2851023 RepID=UPI00225E42EB|nr:DEAD/DEAH box helicase [Anianabacter salinae]MBV0912161.1 DEAD/DEAH box helicase [Anianabacter salinae]
MSFDQFGLAPRLSKTLADLGLTEPTPIQIKAIPHAMEGRDVMGLAQTGTGKTMAFGLPLLNALIGMGTKPAAKTVRGLILAPTRELASQICDSLSAFTRDTHLRVTLVVGGASMNAQIGKLSRGTDILVATPGRLIDHLDRKTVRLDEARFLVLDEADQMLDMGFIHALRQIAPYLAPKRQTMLFSATMPALMEELAGTFLDDPIKVQANPPGQPVEKIAQEVHFVSQGDKPDLLMAHLRKDPDAQAIVFARTKHGSERLMKSLVKAGFVADSIHGNKSHGQRTRALDAFRSGEMKVLVATDVAARGLDIPEVRYVYNYDLPNVPENYVHRIGRTARAGREGTAIAYCSADEMDQLRDIQKVIKRDIEVAGGQPWGPSRSAPAPKRGGKPGGGSRGKPQGQRSAKPGADKAQQPRKPAHQGQRKAGDDAGAGAQPPRRRRFKAGKPKQAA